MQTLYIKQVTEIMILHEKMDKDTHYRILQQDSERNYKLRFTLNLETFD